MGTPRNKSALSQTEQRGKHINKYVAQPVETLASKNAKTRFRYVSNPHTETSFQFLPASRDEAVVFVERLKVHEDARLFRRSK